MPPAPGGHPTLPAKPRAGSHTEFWVGGRIPDMTRYARSMDALDRITVIPGVCGGQPTIRGLRIPVGLIVRHVANGQTMDQVISEYPELQPEDIRQALLYAAWAASGRTVGLPSP